jgi:hypothetical protein
VAALQQMASSLGQGADASSAAAPATDSGTSSYGTVTQAVVNPQVDQGTAAALAAQYGGGAQGAASTQQTPASQAADASSADTAAASAPAQPATVTASATQPAAASTAAVPSQAQAYTRPVATAAASKPAAKKSSQAAALAGTITSVASPDSAAVPSAASSAAASALGASVPAAAGSGQAATGTELPPEVTAGRMYAGPGQQQTGPLYNAGMPTSAQQAFGGVTGLVADAMLNTGRRLRQIDVRLLPLDVPA